MKTVSELADQLVDVIADEDPLLATMYGIRSKDRDLRDHDEDADRKLVARATAIGQAADSIPNASLSDEEKVTKSVVRELAIAVRLRQAARAVEYTVTDFLVAPAARALHYLPRTPVA